MPEFKVVEQDGWFKQLVLGHSRLYITLSHSDVTIITNAADPVAAFSAIIPHPLGVPVSLGIITTRALLSILEAYHGDDGIVISFPFVGGAHVPLAHSPSIWDELP
jgi:hypothetical protein